MGMPRVARRRANVSPWAGQRVRTASGSSRTARRAAKSAARPLHLVPHPWGSFVVRCLRSWAQAGASASEFLATWTPLRLPEPLPYLPGRPDPARRKPTGLSRRAGWRPTRHPGPSAGAAAWSVPVAAAGSAEALRARYPLVSALLVELAQLPGGGRIAARTQQRG
jgi:hypothetical protein